jgi:hypothetical protein
MRRRDVTLVGVTPTKPVPIALYQILGSFGERIMKRRVILVGAAALAAALLLLSTTIGQEKTKPEQYSAVWAVVGGTAGGTTVSIDIRINRYNTDADVQKFAEQLKEFGADALRRAMEKEDVGQLSPVGRVGVPIAIARKLTQGKKTIVRVVTARSLSFVEIRYSGRSVDYPYTILQLELDESGKGTGTAIGAAKIRFNKKENTYEIESLEHGTSVNKLLNVQLVK